MLLRVLPLAAFGAALLLIGASQWPTGSTPSAAARTNCDATPISDTAVAQMLVLINQAMPQHSIASEHSFPMDIHCKDYQNLQPDSWLRPHSNLPVAIHFE